MNALDECFKFSTERKREKKKLTVSWFNDVKIYACHSEGWWEAVSDLKWDEAAFAEAQQPVHLLYGTDTHTICGCPCLFLLNLPEWPKCLASLHTLYLSPRGHCLPIGNYILWASSFPSLCDLLYIHMICTVSAFQPNVLSMLHCVYTSDTPRPCRVNFTAFLSAHFYVQYRNIPLLPHSCIRTLSSFSHQTKHRMFMVQGGRRANTPCLLHYVPPSLVHTLFQVQPQSLNLPVVYKVESERAIDSGNVPMFTVKSLQMHFSCNPKQPSLMFC